MDRSGGPAVLWERLKPSVAAPAVETISRCTWKSTPNTGPEHRNEAVQLVLVVQLAMQYALCVAHQAGRPTLRRRSWLCLLFVAG